MKLVVPGSSKWGFSQYLAHSLFGKFESAFRQAQQTGEFAEPTVQFKKQKPKSFTLKFFDVVYKMRGRGFQYESENLFPFSGTIEKIKFKNNGTNTHTPGSVMPHGLPQKLNVSELEIAILQKDGWNGRNNLEGLYMASEYEEKMFSGDDVLKLSKHGDGKNIDMGEGDDQIISPKKTNGVTWVRGGPGADTFVLKKKGDGHMLMRDFSYLEGDKIKLPFSKIEYEIEWVSAGHPYELDSTYIGFHIRREGDLAGIVDTGIAVGDEGMSADLIYESMI